MISQHSSPNRASTGGCQADNDVVKPLIASDTLPVPQVPNGPLPFREDRRSLTTGRLSRGLKKIPSSDILGNTQPAFEEINKSAAAAVRCSGTPLPSLL